MNIGVKPDEQTNLYDEIGKLTGWEREQTNKEWIQSATTEQLAEFLIASIKKCKSCASGIGFDEVPCCPFGECGCHFKGEVVEWLKKQHDESCH